MEYFPVDNLYHLADVNATEVQQRIEQFETLCRERGLPLTVQRRATLEVVLERDDHPSADQVYEAVRERIPDLSRATVYRALETLVGLGVIRRLHHPGAGARFDGKIRRHHHLVCRKCHQVVDVESSKLDDLRLPPGQRQGFEIEDYSVHFVGICETCRLG
jgi:Fur family peroxide stress response transcriptional regulator